MSKGRKLIYSHEAGVQLKYPCGIITYMNRAHSDMKQKLHLRVCEVCKNRNITTSKFSKIDSRTNKISNFHSSHTPSQHLNQ